MSYYASTLPVPAPADKRFEYLSDVSAEDRTWDDHRVFADTMQAVVEAAGYQRYSERVRKCAQALFFEMQAATATGEISYKLTGADFCHWRHCPVCQWRRSLRDKAIFLSYLPVIEEQYPKARWLLLTLTIRNCHVSDLRETIRGMNQAWKRLLLRPEFSIVDGWIRSVEVTRSEDGSAHPHYHCLLMVPPSYFSGREYVKTERWATVWGECLGVDYTPVCDVRIVKPKLVKDEATGQLVPSKGALVAAAAEVLKYATKGQDLIDGGPDWLGEYIEQVRSLKFLTSGGALKGIFKRTKPDTDDDLIRPGGEEPEPESVDLGKVRFDWMKPVRRYGRKRKHGE
ncbi:MAG: protein rep [Acidithiobacillus sp.]|nr:protein rep [Acidithiobacillus sp.]